VNFHALALQRRPFESTCALTAGRSRWSNGPSRATLIDRPGLRSAYSHCRIVPKACSDARCLLSGAKQWWTRFCSGLSAPSRPPRFGGRFSVGAITRHNARSCADLTLKTTHAPVAGRVRTAKQVGMRRPAARGRRRSRTMSEQRTSPDRSAGNSLRDKILADAAIERAIAATRPKRNPQ
jgi:hypothetical protein